ncbi:hypothetical protein K2173_011687 [Erythroxylum novogranatense]|uniref:Thioredoxin domain-containing protein n=1 Tax=Erythroxylum novogranatense TaxID=1862640 RepID=A0AAV8T1Z6_9ROSI|nr:hypothetical protein K2173_011687 [Erythroxylum novogranatense]
MSASKALLFFFTTTLILFTFFYVTPLSHFRSPILQKLVLSMLFDQQDDQLYPLAPTLITQDIDDQPVVPRVEDSFPEEDGEHKSRVVVFDDMIPLEWPEVDEKDVVVLGALNFSNFVDGHQFVLVNFYAPWCNWSQQLAPEYAAAATMLKGEAVLAKVDNWETGLRMRYSVEEYPTIYLFVGGSQGQRVSYTETRTREAITTWVKQRIYPTVQNITEPEEVNCILSSKSMVAVGFLDSFEDLESEQLTMASKLHFDVDFYQTTDSNVAKLFNIDPQAKLPVLIMLNKEGVNHTRFMFEGQFTESAISEFISESKLPSMITYSDMEAHSIYQNPMKKLWLFAPGDSREVISTFQEAAKAFRKKILFIHVDSCCGARRKQFASHFGVTGDSPRVVAEYVTDNIMNTYMYPEKLTLTNIKSLAEEFLKAETFSQLHMRLKMVNIIRASANFPVEEDIGQRPTGEQSIFNEKGKAVVLSKGNFSEFISKNKYVMVNFYAPWCQWSKLLAPEYEAAAAILNGEAVIAKVDAVAETMLAYKYKIQGYPTLFFFVNGVHKETYYYDRRRYQIARWVLQKIEEYRPTATMKTEEAADLMLVPATYSQLLSETEDGQ